MSSIIFFKNSETKSKPNILLRNIYALWNTYICGVYVCMSVTQPCPILCDPKQCNPPGSSVKNTGVGQHSFLQGIFLTQGLKNLGLLHCRQILYCLSHQGSPYYVVKSLKKIQIVNFRTIINPDGMNIVMGMLSSIQLAVTFSSLVIVLIFSFY